MKKQLTFLLVLCFAAFTLQAQITTPAASPSAKIMQNVGLTEVTVEYSRPSAKGRTIFATDGLVSYGKIWRTGANAATKLTFSDAVTLGGTALEAGSYAVLTVPAAAEWAFELYPYESGSWGSYVEKTPTTTFKVPTQKTGQAIESFTIDVNNLKSESATIDFMWANTKVSVPLEVAVEERVMANIEKVMAGPSANDYYAAATYYHDSGKDLNQALEWVRKTTAVPDDQAKFWQVRRESLILADLGRYTTAIAAAQRSKMLAEKAGNDDYVKMNNDSIAEWTKMSESGRKSVKDAAKSVKEKVKDKKKSSDMK